MVSNGFSVSFLLVFKVSKRTKLDTDCQTMVFFGPFTKRGLLPSFAAAALRFLVLLHLASGVLRQFSQSPAKKGASGPVCKPWIVSFIWIIYFVPWQYLTSRF